MSQRTVTKQELADLFGLSPKQIERYVTDGIPCQGTGQLRRFPWPEVRNWRYALIRQQEREATEKRLEKPDAEAVKQARDQLVLMEARQAAMDLAEREKVTILKVDCDRVMGEVIGELGAVLQNIPSDYQLDLERAGVESGKAQEILETISEKLTRSLRGKADDFDALDESHAA